MSPALADANNGNWQTASRWQRMLAPLYRTRIVRAWPDGRAAERDDAMIALHAVRSLASISSWVRQRGEHGLAVVLTGTDLYGPRGMDPLAREGVALAQRLVVLQERGPGALPAGPRGKVRVIFQSTTRRATLAKTPAHLRALMVGHLREVKSPQTLFEAARLLCHERDILIDHVGEALDAKLGNRARAAERAFPNYRWLKGLPHEDVRRRIQRAHVLVHASRVEGGAHVIMEAVCCGTPVLASAVEGNIGMLGAGYAGYFPHGDANALARMLVQCRGDSRLLRKLREQGLARAPLFTAAAEKAAVQRLVEELLGSHVR